MHKALVLAVALALCGRALADLQPDLLHFFHHQHVAVSGAPVSGAPGTTVTPQAVPVGCKSAADIASASADFTTLVAAAQAAGLASALSSPSLSATVFAPTNDAFAALLKSMSLTPAQLLANATLLQSVLKYHVLPVPMTSDMLAAGSGNKLDTLLPKHSLVASVLDVFSFHAPSSKVLYIVPEASTPAKVIQADINAGCPTVVHVIDGVLLPGPDMPTHPWTH